jgi:hypothetical protein
VDEAFCQSPGPSRAQHRQEDSAAGAARLDAFGPGSGVFGRCNLALRKISAAKDSRPPRAAIPCGRNCSKLAVFERLPWYIAKKSGRNTAGRVFSLRNMTIEAEYQRGLREREARQQRLDAIVKAATDTVVATIADTTPRLQSNFFFGATGIHPRHLATWYLFSTDADFAEAKRIGLTERIDRLTRENLEQGGYPAESIPEIFVSFTTDEDIQRETGGDYWAYFK